MRDLIRLVSSAGTGHFYTTDKNKRTTPDKIEIKKFDPGQLSTLNCQAANHSRTSPNRWGFELLFKQAQTHGGLNHF